MLDFDRKIDELPPFLYNIGDKVMGFHESMGSHILVGGEIVGRKQSTSYLDDNEYTIKIEPELCEGSPLEIEITWWLNEKEAKPFKQELWNKAVKHWMEHCKLKAKSYLEFVRMHRALIGKPDDMTDEELQKELDDMRKIKE